MATIVQEFGLSAEKTEFSGSSEEDMAYAKSFWQSVQLLPPMESRLVSSTIRQRLRTAPSSRANVSHQSFEDPPQLASFLAKAQALQRQEELSKLERYAILREQDMALLAKHREQREEKEKISAGHKGRTRPPEAMELVCPQRPLPNSVEHKDRSQIQEEIQQTSKAIEDFERQKVQSGAGLDSDSN